MNKLNSRLKVTLITGAILGVFCVIGGGIRAGGWEGNQFFLTGMWYNRVIMGLVLGLAGDLKWIKGAANRYLRGAVLGFAVSLAFFLSTAMRDIPALLAGIVYGVIIEYTAYRFAK